MCTGKASITGCGAIGNEGSVTEATDQDATVDIPAEPVIATSTSDVECSIGPIAIALNGVSMYSGVINAACDLLDVDDDSSEWTGFDFCSGHSQLTGDCKFAI